MGSAGTVILHILSIVIDNCLHFFLCKVDVLKRQIYTSNRYTQICKFRIKTVWIIRFVSMLLLFFRWLINKILWIPGIPTLPKSCNNATITQLSSLISGAIADLIFSIVSATLTECSKSPPFCIDDILCLQVQLARQFLFP